MASVFSFVGVLLVFVNFMLVPPAQGWSKEGHILTCEIAQGILSAEALEAVQNLLPETAKGNLSSLCVWPDEVRFRYRWSSPLHYINTPDNVCTFVYSRDCHDQNGVKDRCVAGAILNYTSQLVEYRDGSSDRRQNSTEALLFLSHFVGDIHQPLHVGFTSDEGGNTINVRWFRRKSNLHHVWDRDIILEALKDYYDRDAGLLFEDLLRNLTDGIWTDEVPSWENCPKIDSCVNKWAKESINAACKWAYEGVEDGATLSEEYYDSRLGIVMERIAQGGVRLGMLLNWIFSKEAAANQPKGYRLLNLINQVLHSTININ